MLLRSLSSSSTILSHRYNIANLKTSVLCRPLSSTHGTIQPSDYRKEIEEIKRDYEERSKRKQALVGKVVSTKCSKSISVMVHHEKYYPKYDKYVTVRKKVMAHDEEEQANEGDVVRIAPCRPMSRWKRHQLMDIIRKGVVVDFSDIRKVTDPLGKLSATPK